MKYLLSILLFAAFSVGATSFTEFYCDANGGTNINSGDSTNFVADYTSLAGNWTAASSTFTPTDGSYPANTNTIAQYRWASVVISGSTNLVQTSKGGYVARVLTINSGQNGTIVLSANALAGTAPGNQTGTAELRVGGAWRGPYGSTGFGNVQFPFSFIATTATNAPQNMPRVNFRNAATYNVTAAMTHSSAGPILFQGMTASPGDLGKATIDGGTSGNYYTVLTISGSGNDFADLIFSHQGGTSSTVDAIIANQPRNTFLRCVSHDMRGTGFSVSANTIMVECEAYACNAGNVAGKGGFVGSGAPVYFMRCISHDNSSANAPGFVLSSGAILLNCIAYANGSSGVSITSGETLPCVFAGCDFFDNNASGLDSAATAEIPLIIQNCNFVSNSVYGVTSSGSSLRNGFMLNNGFGSGTMANQTADVAPNMGGINEIGSVTYGANQTPWVSPTTGNFSINLTSAKSAGRGLFTQGGTTGSTVAFPDIGAGQASDTNTTATAGGSYTFAQ